MIVSNRQNVITLILNTSSRSCTFKGKDIFCFNPIDDDGFGLLDEHCELATPSSSLVAEHDEEDEGCESAGGLL